LVEGYESQDNTRAACLSEVHLYVKFLTTKEVASEDIDVWSSRTDPTHSNNHYESLVRTIVASALLATIQGRAEEMSGGVAT
jgi:hypothetical protein